LVTRISALPGVVSVGRAGAGVPLGPRSGQRVPVEIDGRPTVPPDARQAIVAEVDPAYLQTLGVPLVRGRGFIGDDRPATIEARAFKAVVNETFAKSYLGDEPLGRTVRAPLPGALSLGPLTFTVVGVSRDFRQERPPAPITPLMHVYVPLGSNNTPLVLRTSSDVDTVRRDVRAVVRQMDPELRVAVVQSFGDAASKALAQELLYQRTLGLFSVLALGLAVVGVFGVVSFLTGQRLREFGIRLALGATPSRLFRLVVLSGLRPAAIGLVVGVAIAQGATPAIASVLYGISVRDAGTFVAVAAGIAFVVSLASLAPALRAARVNPAETLRAD
jgi:ABC-type antimicrobial peptide transport system permease subunit